MNSTVPWVGTVFSEARTTLWEQVGRQARQARIRCPLHGIEWQQLVQNQEGRKVGMVIIMVGRRSVQATGIMGQPRPPVWNRCV